MDQYHDTCHKELIKIASDSKLPDYVLAKDLESESLKKLASCDFAFPEARYFPIHTKEDTLLSAAFFLTKQGEFGKYQNSIYDRLRSACTSYNILDDFGNLENLEKKASVKEYAIPELEKFPINTEDEVMFAFQALNKQSHLIEVDKYLEIKNRIEKKAQDLGVTSRPVPRILDFEKAADYMIHRAKKTSNPLLKEAMLKVVKAMLLTKEDFTNDDETIYKVAEFIDRFDNLSGVNRRGSYGIGKDSITRGGIFSSLTKLASAPSLTIEGKTYNASDLEKVSVAQLRDGLGESFVEAISLESGELDLTKFAEIAETLPLPDKRILALYLP